MGKKFSYEGVIATGVGLAFAFAVSMFAEIFTICVTNLKIRRKL